MLSPTDKLLTKTDHIEKENMRTNTCATYLPSGNTVVSHNMRTPAAYGIFLGSG
jgi:hypothetical protein